MSQVNMVVIDKNHKRNVTKVEEKLKNTLGLFLVQLPMTPITGGKQSWMIPKSNYKKVKTESQRLLTDSAVATDVFSLLSAMESEHEAIYFEK